MVRYLLTPLRWLWRLISPAADSAQALLIRTIVIDLVRSMVSKSPGLLTAMNAVFQIVDELRKIMPIKDAVATRVVESVLFDLKNDLKK